MFCTDCRDLSANASWNKLRNDEKKNTNTSSKAHGIRCSGLQLASVKLYAIAVMMEVGKHAGDVVCVENWASWCAFITTVQQIKD